MCVPRRTLLCTQLRALRPCTQARVFVGINFGALVKNSPSHQIKIPAKVSGYTVLVIVL